MTFESLVIAGLSIGLSYHDILEMDIGLTCGLINEKNNQMIEENKKTSSEEKVIHGDAKMLMNM